MIKRFLAQPMRVIFLILGLLILANLALLLSLGLPMLNRSVVTPSPTQTDPVASLTATSTPLPSKNTLEVSPTSTSTSTVQSDLANAVKQQGAMVLSIMDNGYYHLFAYHPQYLPFTRLTNSNWDDVDPAISPDGTKIAFSSRQNGYWDIYVLNLADGSLSRITDTPDYDGHPSWSPDGEWLAYESYQSNKMIIHLRAINNTSQPPVILSDGSSYNSSPSWSPQGREIAFISNQNGKDEVWVANLDKVDNRYQNISHEFQGNEKNPAWSPDGHFLAWSIDDATVDRIAVKDKLALDKPVNIVGTGDHPIWNPDGSMIATVIEQPNSSSIAVYQVSSGNLEYPYTTMTSSPNGLDWKGLATSKDFQANQPSTPNLLTDSQTFPSSTQRLSLVVLPDVSAPTPKLVLGADVAFQSLRQRVIDEAGWDFLASLENAFTPLTTPADPGIENDWLYTGRAFAVNTQPLNAGWMFLSREDYNGQTYWRVYLKTRFQDGSQGHPVHLLPWDVSTRYSGDTQAYELGGKFGAEQPGYWIDFTELAARFGWQRLPSLMNWRTYFAAIRFNVFALKDSLDWKAAMEQLYPPEALVTPTPAPSPTISPSPTSRWSRPKSPTPTRTPTSTSTLHPTWTLPVFTSTP